MSDAARDWVTGLHTAAVELFTTLDGAGRVESTPWERPGGGGGVACRFTGGLFEKAGINRSAVHGELTAELARVLASSVGGATHFFATGLSLVAHPWSPRVPTVHLNVRYFELLGVDGTLMDCWYGGGTDLTPTWPHASDARHFHTVLRDLCNRHAASFYPRFKQACDEYFVNAHRGHEPRGVGGIFFDHLRAEAEGMPAPALHAFVDDLGHVLDAAYRPIVQRRRDEPWDESDRALQLFRRGRYAEFNLLHDRGTLFGLRTGARIDSILMSLPPLAAWPAEPEFAAGSPGARLAEMLAPRVWADLGTG